MACRECCRQALHNTKLQSTGVRSLLSIGVLVQVIRAKQQAGQRNADNRVGAARRRQYRYSSESLLEHEAGRQEALPAHVHVESLRGMCDSNAAVPAMHA